MAEDWSIEEVEATTADYIAMLKLELRREPFNKKERNRALQQRLRNRSPGAIEFKHANISAVLVELGIPYIEGYKPRSNYQDLLREVVERHVAFDGELAALLAAAVARQVRETPDVRDLQQVIVPPPVRERERPRAYERRAPLPRPRQRVNYLEREARNASLGAAGEDFVLRIEHERLWQAGHRQLAERIEHVARTRGDGLGYDIVSFEPTGRERLIEVKTTRFGQMTPFFASRNEVAVSEERSDHYHLYRVFSFEASPRIFVLPGSLRTSCVLEPVEYQANLP